MIVYGLDNETDRSAFYSGIADPANRLDRSSVLFRELQIVESMSIAETQRHEALELMSFDYALSPDASYDPRFKDWTLEQREDIAFKSACWVIEAVRERNSASG